MSEIEQSEKVPTGDWKRDSIWHYRNFVLAAFGIIITVSLGLLIYNWQKPVKALTCDVVTDGPLVSVEDDVNKRVQIMFDHAPVQNVNFAIIKITNPGNIPIDKADFERPLSLQFGAPGKGSILTSQLLDTHPSNIGATYKVIGEKLTLDPLLLNPDDSITLKVIYTGESKSMTLDTRVVGVSDVTGTDPEREAKAEIAETRIISLLVALVVSSGTLLFANISIWRTRQRLKDEQNESIQKLKDNENDLLQKLREEISKHR